MNAKSQLLLAITGLVIAFVRNFLQYQRYSFDSIWEFVGFWLLHYMAIGFLGAVFYACLGPVRRIVLGGDTGGVWPRIDEAIASWCLALLLCAAAVFVLAHWPAGLADSFAE